MIIMASKKKKAIKRKKYMEILNSNKDNLKLNNGPIQWKTEKERRDQKRQRKKN